MPKQGRRWTIDSLATLVDRTPGARCGSAHISGGRILNGPATDGPIEVMPTQEHVAVLEGLAESFEKSGHRYGDATYHLAAKEVRNLIEQGGAGVKSEMGDGVTTRVSPAGHAEDDAQKQHTGVMPGAVGVESGSPQTSTASDQQGGGSE